MVCCVRRIYDTLTADLDAIVAHQRIALEKAHGVMARLATKVTIAVNCFIRQRGGFGLFAGGENWEGAPPDKSAILSDEEIPSRCQKV